jgi:hypothetical protein
VNTTSDVDTTPNVDTTLNVDNLMEQALEIAPALTACRREDDALHQSMDSIS